MSPKKKSHRANPIRYTVFSTNLGWMTIAWSESEAGIAIASVALPLLQRERVTKNILCHFPQAQLKKSKLPADVSKLILQVRKHLKGELQSFSDISLDLREIPALHQEIYQQAQKIRPGQSLTNLEFARRWGRKSAGQLVQEAMAQNRFAILVPCHRVLAPPIRKTLSFSVADKLKRRIFQLEADAVREAWGFPLDEAMTVLRKSDRRLQKLFRDVGDFTLIPDGRQSPFEALLRSIVYQQLNGRAAGTILSRVQAIYGGRYPTPDQIIETASEKLRAAGLSQNKMLAIRDLAQKANEGVVPTLRQMRKLSDDEIVERLTSVRGIGRWTVEMLLIFRLGRKDVLPVDDFALRKSIGQLYQLKEMPKPKEFIEIGNKWRPYRTLVSWYLWRALDL
jgi:3-methyladenine DNA glycosylase/8-oxoguanine DNA glycosylase